MTPNAANSEKAPIPNTVTEKNRELTLNELATIPGGSGRKAGGAPVKYLQITMETATVSGVS